MAFTTTLFDKPVKFFSCDMLIASVSLCHPDVFLVMAKKTNVAPGDILPI
jgi:uncharacterized Zn-finger protein